MKSPLFSLGHFSKETVIQCVTEGWNALTSSIFILMQLFNGNSKALTKSGLKNMQISKRTEQGLPCLSDFLHHKGFLSWTPILMVISFEALISNQTGIICCMPILKTSTFPTFCVHLCFIYAVFLFFCLTIGPIQDVFEPIHVGQVGSFNPNQTHLLFVVGVVKSTTSMSNGRSTSLEKKKQFFAWNHWDSMWFNGLFFPLWQTPVFFSSAPNEVPPQHRRKLRTPWKFNIAPEKLPSQ